MRLATAWAVIVAGFLILIKFIGLLVTGSVAILGSLIDSLMDAFASAVNFFAVRHALTPPDHDHRFGHGKAEALAGLAQFALMSGSAAFLLFESIDRLFNPVDLERTDIGVVVIVVAIVATLGLVAFQRYVIKRTNSLAISADELHYRGDILMNGAVLVALGLSTYGGIKWADAVFGIAIAAYLGYAASQIMRRAYDELMDREFDEADRTQIRAIAQADPDVQGTHDLRTRRAGVNSFIQFHLELDPEISLVNAHEIADRVEAKVREAFPDADVIIHQDPAGLEQITSLQKT
jgi:ferrous-iron efflux pump FieF